MIVLVSGATATLRSYVHTGLFGQLMVPRAGNVPTDLPWAADNDAFNGFDAFRFRKMLDRLDGFAGCLFVACPDVVCDPEGTRMMFDPWSEEIRATGKPVAFVGQHGCERMNLPWDQFEAFFVGGSTEWKESKKAMRLCDKAKEHGKWVHVGRVNTFRRMRKVWDWGSVDSVDGRSFSAWPRIYMPKAVQWLMSLKNQSSFLGVHAR